METLSRYKRQLENTNSRLESELEETKKLMASRDQVSDDVCTVNTCTRNFSAKKYHKSVIMITQHTKTAK